MATPLFKTPVAVAVSIAVVRTYVRLRRILDSRKDLAHELAAVEKRTDQRFKAVLELSERLMDTKRDSVDHRIGFRVQ